MINFRNTELNSNIAAYWNVENRCLFFTTIGTINTNRRKNIKSAHLVVLLNIKSVHLVEYSSIHNIQSYLI